MDKSSVLVSIITISYNSAKTIKDSLVSVLEQTHSQIEYIVVDGKSADGTLAIVESYRRQFEDKNINLKVVSEKDEGIADAWNKGLKLATGDIIGILNSDDWYGNNAVEVATNALDLNKKQISYGICNKIDANGEVVHIMKNTFRANRVYLNFGFSHTTCFVTKKTYEAVGYFNLNYKIALDVDFLLRSVKDNVDFIKTNTVTYMRMGGISTSNKRSALKEYQQALRKNGYNRFLIGIFGTLKKIILYLKQNN